MAPSRGKGKARASTGSNGTATPSRRTPRSTRKGRDGVPDVYKDMLAEAEASGMASDASDRPLKKRKVAASVTQPLSKSSIGASGKRPKVDGGGAPAAQSLQTVEDSSATDDEDESDFGFEDVDLEQPTTSSPAPAEQDEDGIADVSVSVDPATTPKRSASMRRKPVSVAEKTFRLLVHKAHVLCLLGHCIYINGWCNNEAVQRHLRPMLPTKTLSYLNPRSDDSQFQRNRSFMDGLLQASDAFRGQFRVNASGIRRARWVDADGEDDGTAQSQTEPMDRVEFINAAKKLEGSQDTGNQLFCALLRSAGVDARVVCSLQPLPIANAPSKSTTSQKTVKSTIYAMNSGTDSPGTDSNAEDASVRSSSSIGKVPPARRRLGQPAFAAEAHPTSTTPKKKRPVRKLSYPIFWVEAFNTAHQKWIAVDPLVTQTISKPSKLEPPSSYDHNQLTYVITFESSGVARDVTRRYAKSFNAKTRRYRVESTENGALWLKKALSLFRRRGEALDRDQVEDSELAQREAREGLPTNVQDFKDHPYYALERHLKRHEVIHPRREVGKVNAGTAAKPRMEVVFRRTDVCVCRSAEKWFRVGREVVEGEQAVKRVLARRVRKDGGEGEDRQITALYALFQTKVYVPPPVVNGKVPRNAYGNLDVYVPSMVPAGGRHVRHQLAKEAARSLKVDFAEAVTGFQFKGRQGTAVTEGVIVPDESTDAVEAAIEGLQDDRVDKESMARSAVALRTWKRFLVGLKIQQRVSTYADPATEEDIKKQIDEQDLREDGGGFMPDGAVDEVEALPTAGRFSLMDLNSSAWPSKRAKKRLKSGESEEETEYSGDGDIAEDEEERMPTRRTTRARRVIAEESEEKDMHDNEPLMPEPETENAGGGFMLEDGTDGPDCGGFVPDDDAAMNYEQGGGFVPEDIDNDGEGGGFMVEDADMAGDEADGADGFVRGANETPKVVSGRGFDVSDNLEMSGGLSVDEVEDNHMQQEATTQKILAPLDENTPTETNLKPDVLESTSDAYTDGVHLRGNGDLLKDSRLSPATVADQCTTTPREEAHEGSQDGNDSDRGSMMSHDPEDEDAEPDWLESD